MSGKLEWVPMESNPDVMNLFLRKVGVKSHLNIVDVLGFDEELLQMVEGKVEGILFCYPMRGDQSIDCAIDSEALNKLYFMRQTIRNACGTMALIHLVANLCQEEDFEANSSIKKFIKDSKLLEPERKADIFEGCESIASAHANVSGEGQSEAPAASNSVEHHFISIIHKDGFVYEMDGRKLGPVNHGPTSDATFLKDAVRVVKKFIEHNPSNIDIAMQAFTRNGN